MVQKGSKYYWHTTTDEKFEDGKTICESHGLSLAKINTATNLANTLDYMSKYKTIFVNILF